MTGHANFQMLFHETDDSKVTISDIGPHTTHKTITNDVEWVCGQLKELGFLKPGRRLFYYDSAGELSELLHNGERFIGFA